jgi:hypothetical protein
VEISKLMTENRIAVFPTHLMEIKGKDIVDNSAILMSFNNLPREVQVNRNSSKEFLDIEGNSMFNNDRSDRSEFNQIPVSTSYVINSQNYPEKAKSDSLPEERGIDKVIKDLKGKNKNLAETLKDIEKENAV